MSGELVLTLPKWGVPIGFLVFLVVTMNDWQPVMTGIFNYFPSRLYLAIETPLPQWSAGWKCPAHSSTQACTIHLSQHLLHIPSMASQQLLHIFRHGFNPGRKHLRHQPSPEDFCETQLKRTWRGQPDDSDHRPSWPRDCHILHDTLFFYYQANRLPKCSLFSICNNTTLNFN